MNTINPSIKVPVHAERVYRKHFPYGLKQLKNGKYFIFNRNYQPLGSMKEEILSIYADEHIPEEITFKIDLTAKVIKTLSVDHSLDPSIIFLYDDRNNPLNSDETMQRYTEKLRLLMTLNCW